MDTKTTGWVFLSIGVFIMALSVVLVVLAFTNVIRPSYLGSSLSAPKKPAVVTDINSINSGQANLPSLMPSLDAISPESLNDVLNLSTHFFLMVFVGGFGHKLAMIGVNLIRPIVVKTSNKRLEESPPQV
ncbi:MAG: hypothetical protein AAB675_03425 [Patescibacteria group bacterium]